MTRWALAIVLTMAASGARAQEALCTSLGSDCICNEQMDTDTVNGGQQWPASGNVNFDDSPPATECTRYEFNPPAIADSVAASGQPLPAGHSLTWVHRHQQTGSQEARVVMPYIQEAKNVTVCTRTYQRFDPTAPIPPGGNDQYKVQTIGGRDQSDQAQTYQISVSAGGTLTARADAPGWNIPGDSQTTGHMDECRSNWCRFETCLDLDNAGFLTVRHRKTELEPSANEGRQYTAVKPTSLNSRDTLCVGCPLGPGPTTIWTPQFFAQGLGATAIRYAAYAIFVKQRPMDTSFWPGAASEIEGGAAPPPPPMVQGIRISETTP